MREEALNTPRLALFPLNARQLRLWLEDITALEGELGCTYDAQALDGFFGDVVRGQLAQTEADPDHYKYHSFWWIVRRADCVAVGSCDFKGPPDANGEVEIGYGLGEQHQGHGYMTEAIGALCRWALEQADIRHVIAETEAGNIKSENILKRLGFSPFCHAQSNWWRL